MPPHFSVFQGQCTLHDLTPWFLGLMREGRREPALYSTLGSRSRVIDIRALEFS
jgi:hypothetical protein